MAAGDTRQVKVHLDGTVVDLVLDEERDELDGVRR